MVISRQSKIIVLLIALPFAEVAVTILFTNWLGAAWTYSLFAVPTVIGLVLHWRRWPKVKADWEIMQAILKDAKEKEQNIGDDAGKSAQFNNCNIRLYWFWLSVILLLIPGFFTDVIAFGIFFMERLFGEHL